MSTNSPLTLDSINQQILGCQDEAFTMAIYLVGDEQLACQIVQEAVQNVYSNVGGRTQPIDLQVLSGVVFSCQWGDRSFYAEAIPISGWSYLERREKEVLLLVDVLGKTYDETALILNMSCQEITQNLAMGRRILARSIHAETVPCEIERMCG